MPIRYYLDPQASGPFVTPQVSQHAQPTFGGVESATYNVNYSGQIFVWPYATDAVLPQFAFTTRKPVDGTDRVEVQRTFSFRAGNVPSGNLYTVFAPICIGVLCLGADKYVNPGYDMLPNQSSADVNGETQASQFQNKSASYFTKSGGLRWYADHGVAPLFAYVWRPSTGAIVAYLWSANTNAWYYSNACHATNSTQTPDESYRWSRTAARAGWGTSGVYLTGWRTPFSALAGDCICVEYWGCMKGGSNQTVGTIPGISLFDITMSIGGGTDYDGAIISGGNGASDGATPIHNTFFNFKGDTNLTMPFTMPPTGTLDGAANLIDVSPGGGPRISLTFDNSVGVIGPTIGAASGGVAVTGVTAIDATHIDLDLAIAPTETLTGSAQGCNVQPAPSGTAWTGV